MFVRDTRASISLSDTSVRFYLVTEDMQRRDDRSLSQTNRRSHNISRKKGWIYSCIQFFIYLKYTEVEDWLKKYRHSLQWEEISERLKGQRLWELIKRQTKTFVADKLRRQHLCKHYISIDRHWLVWNKQDLTGNQSAWKDKEEFEITPVRQTSLKLFAVPDFRDFEVNLWKNKRKAGYVYIFMNLNASCQYWSQFRHEDNARSGINKQVPVRGDAHRPNIHLA